MVGAMRLEIGTYCGQSALRLAHARPDMRLLSLELDPIHAFIARRLIAFAELRNVEAISISKPFLSQIASVLVVFNGLKPFDSYVG